MKSRNLLVVLVLIFSVLFTATSCTTKKQTKGHGDAAILPPETIDGDHYIAIAAPLTGAYSELGKSILEGAKLAVKEFNAVAPSKVGILTIDDGGLVVEALKRADLIIEQKCLGVIGHLNSEVSIEASKKYFKAGIPQISPASTHPTFTERPDFKGYVFRTIGTDRQLGESAAKHVLSDPNIIRVAVLYNDRPYGVSVAGEFVRRLAKDTSKDIVIYETIPVRTKDHKKTAGKVAKKNPDLVFFVGEYNDAGYLLKALKSKLPAVRFLASEGVHNEAFIKIAGKSAESAIVMGMEPLQGEAKTRYKSSYQKDETGFVKSSYDATKLLLSAIHANNYKNPRAIASTISKNPNMDPNGDLIRPNFVLYTVKNSKFEIL